MALGRDPEFVRLNGGDASKLQPFTESDADRWVRAYPDSHRWMIEHERRLIGEVRLDRVDRAARSARLAIGIYSSGSWDRGLGTEATRLVLRHGFESLALHRIDLNVLEFNERAIAVYERLGFRREGVLRDRTNVAGVWLSDIRMSLLEDEYRAAR